MTNGIADLELHHGCAREGDKEARPSKRLTPNSLNFANRWPKALLGHGLAIDRNDEDGEIAPLV